MLQSAMGAKKSQEMKEAVRLADEGLSIAEAARIANVHRVSLYRVLRSSMKKTLTRRRK